MKANLVGYARDDRGTTAVEFALVGLMFLFIVFGSFEASRLFFTKNVLQYALEEATRYRIVNEEATREELENLILDEMQSMMVSSDNLELTAPVYEEVGGVRFIQMDAVYNFQSVVPGLNQYFDMGLRATSRMAVGAVEEGS